MLKCKMNDVEIVFPTSSKKIITLAKNLNNDNLQEKLFDSFKIRNHSQKVRRQKGNMRFKVHPNTLSSSDSDMQKQSLTNGYKNHHFPYNCSREKFNDSAHLSANSYYLLSPNRFITLQNHSISDRDSLDSPVFESTPKLETTNSEINEINKKCKKLLNFKKTDDRINVVDSNKSMETKKNETEKKLHNLLHKILSCLEDIQISLDTKIVIPDGEEDWHKRQKRTGEFCSRFQRNYLYQLGRQIADLKKLNSNNINNIHLYSIASAHQTLLQAFQAYHNYIPLGNIVADKLKIVIDHANNLFSVYEKILNVNDDEELKKKNLMELIRNKCVVILNKTNEILEEPLIKKKSTSRCSLVSMKNNVRKKLAAENKFSMYSIPCTSKKKDLWKKTLEAVANNKLKFGPTIVQSRYKTAGYKHRPPVDRSKLIQIPLKAKSMQKHCLASIKETPLESPRNEDEIETMVKMQKEKENMENSKQQISCNVNMNSLNHSNLKELETLVPLLKALCDAISTREHKEVSQKQLETLLKGLLETALSGKINNSSKYETGPHTNNYKHINSGKGLSIKSLPNLLHQVESKIKNGKITITNGHKFSNLENALVESFVELKSENAEQKNVKATESTQSLQNNWKTLEVIGAKNAKLICIQDDSPINESPRQPCPSLITIPPEGIVQTEKEKIENENVESEAVDKSCHKDKKVHTRKTKNIIKINRLPRQYLQKLVPLSKPRLKAILQGKLQHVRLMKERPMYSKTSKTPPWIFVEKISDNLLDDILCVIAEEVQVSKVLENLYTSELQ